MTIFLIVWIIAVGAVIGSFLNVVIWRLPRGQSLISPPSHCPKCLKRIRWFDNVPIFGWVFLNGKCRDCGQPISFRYPLVETICAVFAGVLFGTLQKMDMAFVRPVMSEENLSMMPLSLFELMLRFSWLFLLHCFLLTVGLIELDRQTLPKRFFGGMIAIGIVTGLFFPYLYPFHWNVFWPWETLQEAFQSGRNLHQNSIPDVICGLTVGLTAGKVLSYVTIDKTQRMGWIFVSGIAGLFLGWQLCWMVLAAAMVLHAAVFYITRQKYPLLCLTFSSFLINLLFISSVSTIQTSG
jgi:prepilin signal peptidase PulO-like enzyme (type II secretory pathway)